MNKQATHLQLFGYLLTICITAITAYVILTNKVTALEIKQQNIEEKINKIDKQTETIYNYLINKK